MYKEKFRKKYENHSRGEFLVIDVINKKEYLGKFPEDALRKLEMKNLMIDKIKTTFEKRSKKLMSVDAPLHPDKFTGHFRDFLIGNYKLPIN